MIFKKSFNNLPTKKYLIMLISINNNEPIYYNLNLLHFNLLRPLIVDGQRNYYYLDYSDNYKLI